MPSITPSALTRTRHVLDDAGVDAVMAAAEQAAREKGYRVVIVVVDASGRTLALRRTPGAQPASDQVAIDNDRVPKRAPRMAHTCVKGNSAKSENMIEMGPVMVALFILLTAARRVRCVPSLDHSLQGRYWQGCS